MTTTKWKFAAAAILAVGLLLAAAPLFLVINGIRHHQVYFRPVETLNREEMYELSHYMGKFYGDHGKYPESLEQIEELYDVEFKLAKGYPYSLGHPQYPVLFQVNDLYCCVIDAKFKNHIIKAAEAPPTRNQ